MRPVKLTRPPERLLDVAAILALLALVVLFNPGLAFGGLIPGGYDTLVYFYPYRAYFAEAMAEGRLPLWNPHLFLGVPFLANPQAAVFYPPTLLFAVLDVPSAYVANLLGHVFLAGAGLYAFNRWSFGLRRPASVLGAAAFAFSGFLGGQSGHINQVSVAAWLPVVALALDLTLRYRSSRALAVLVGGLVMQLLAGHPQEVYMTLVVLGIVVLWRRWREGTAALARGVGLLALAVGVAFGIAAIQLLPTAELARLSIRGGGLDYAQATDGSLPWQLLLPAVFPGYWTHLHTTEFFGHLGAIVFGLAWLGLAVGSARPALLGGLLVTVGLLLAVGDTTPLYRVLFDWAPGFASFRVPARWLFVYTFGASLLVAVGTERVTEVASDGSDGGLPSSLPSLATSVTRLLVALVVPLGLAALVVMGQPQSRRLLVIWGALATCSALLGGLAVWRPRLRGVALGLLLAGGLAELWLAGADLEHRHPIPRLGYAEPRESARFLGSRDGLDGRFRMLSIASPEYEVKETPEYRERFGRLHPRALDNLLVAVKLNETLSPNIPLQYRLDGADGYDGGVLPLAAYVRLTGTMVGDRVRPDGVLASRLDALPHRRWLDLLGVRYVLAGRAKDVIHDGLYYDRAITATLRPGERLELRGLPLGEFTRLGVLSSSRGPSRPGQEVARLELDDGAGDLTVLPLVDGQHTAPSRPSLPPPAPSLEPIEPWDGADGSVDWVTQVGFSHRPVRHLTIENTAPDLVLDVRSLNLVDDVRRASFALTLDDSVERTEFFDMKVYDRRESLSRVYAVGRAEVLSDAAALQRLADPSFEPRDLVLLAPDGDAPPVLEAPAATAPAAAAPAVTIESSQPEVVRIRSSGNSAGYVVLSDAWYPGWRATVDGQEAPILRANVLFRAVAVPSGEHRVEFRYAPPSFRLGAGISAASLLAGALAWGAWARKQWRRAA